ncbi:VOC family protein [Curtobacterium sp. L1-20]|uniref:VOC family protein n=1 Tax=Curtobacterium sp. L1-20 TaxID=3138181 RepID=UPI003B524533
MQPLTRPPLAGIHHLKVPVSDLDASLRFYERALGAVRIPEADHVRPDGALFAYILQVAGLDTLLELRLHPVRALLHQGFDPVTMLVRSRAELEQWHTYLRQQEIETSPVLVGLRAWLIAFRDPDGTVLRLYSAETHGHDLAADHESPWLDERVVLDPKGAP